MRRAARWTSGAALGALAVGGGSAGLARMAADPWLGLLLGLAGATVGALVAALTMRWSLEPVTRAEEELLRWLDDPTAPAPAMPEELEPIAEAVARCVERHRQELVGLRRERGALARGMTLARRVSEQSRVGLAIVAREGGVFTFANERFRELCHLRSDPLGRRPLEVVPAVEVHEAVTAALAGEEVERAFATGWGDRKVRVEALDDEHVTVRVEDITAELEAERARANFVANVSHELRTPITALMGYAETLLADAEELPGSVSDMLGAIERNARRLRDLFEDLLRLHRIETRRKQLPVELQPLHPVLVDAVLDAVDRGALRGVELELDVDEGLRGWCHRDALVAMVGNLARNAVAYTNPGGHVWVRAREGEDGAAVIEVEDDGIGIAPPHLERIFERFYRVDEARSRRAGGTGLGLAIVKHYALATHAQVSVHSVHGQGSTFRIALPSAK